MKCRFFAHYKSIGKKMSSKVSVSAGTVIRSYDECPIFTEEALLEANTILSIYDQEYRTTSSDYESIQKTEPLNCGTASTNASGREVYKGKIQELSSTFSVETIEDNEEEKFIKYRKEYEAKLDHLLIKALQKSAYDIPSETLKRVNPGLEFIRLLDARKNCFFIPFSFEKHEYVFEVEVAHYNVSVFLYRRKKSTPTCSASLVLFCPYGPAGNFRCSIWKRQWDLKCGDSLAWGSRNWLVEDQFKKFQRNGKIAFGVENISLA